MNRRNFLQALLAIPAIAAVPFPSDVKALPTLLEVTDEDGEKSYFSSEQPKATVTINGEPVEVRALTFIEKQHYIETTSRSSGNRILHPGLRDGTIELETYADTQADAVVRNAYRAQESVVVRARFGPAELVATGYVRGLSFYIGATEPMRLDIDLSLTKVEWMSV